MTPFDLVLLLIVAETTQQALLGGDFSITNAAILIVTLFTIDIALSYVKQWLPRIGLLIDGTPTVLICDGSPTSAPWHEPASASKKCSQPRASSRASSGSTKSSSPYWKPAPASAWCRSADPAPEQRAACPAPPHESITSGRVACLVSVQP